MKQINVYFEDAEHKLVSDFKGKLSWHDFILLMYTHCNESKKKGEFDENKNQ